MSYFTTVKNGKRPCSDCKVKKPIDNFTMRTGLKWTSSICKACMVKRKTVYSHLHRNKIAAYAKEYNKKRHDREYFGGLRIKALERDNYKCQKCLKDVSNQLDAAVHHINHNKKDNRLENLQTLCNSCHARHHGKINTKNLPNGERIKEMWKLYGAKHFNR